MTVTKNLNTKLMERFRQTERTVLRKCSVLTSNTTEVIATPSSIIDKDLEGKVRKIFGEIGVIINECGSSVTDLGEFC